MAAVKETPGRNRSVGGKVVTVTEGRVLYFKYCVVYYRSPVCVYTAVPLGNRCVINQGSSGTEAAYSGQA